MHQAFKEWAIVVDALVRGEQILIFRKGGISEGPGGFKVDHLEFLLFPTLFHQQRESVIASAAARYDEISPTLLDSAHVKVEAFARVSAHIGIEDRSSLRKLSGQHIWRDEVIESRFEWGKSKSIYALAVRIYRLAPPQTIPNRPEYGGCKSWVELAEDLKTANAKPVLSAAEFETKLARFRDAGEANGY